MIMGVLCCNRQPFAAIGGAAASSSRSSSTDTLGTKLVAIRGYRGSNEITLAIERGELDGFTG
jgi:hypothetical protein